jgi:tight adherence protein B
MWPITAALLFLFYLIPKMILQYFVKRQKILLRDQLVTAMNIISNSVRAGLSLEESIRIVSGEIPEPLSNEFKRMTREHQRGVSFLHTLEDAKKRLDLPGFTLFVSALTANHQRGGKITDVLERLRKSLIENQRLERKLEAETASGNLVILILSVFPYGFLALSLMINYEPTLLLFTTFVGQILFSLVLILTYIGYRWGNKIMNIEF